VPTTAMCLLLWQCHCNVLLVSTFGFAAYLIKYLIKSVSSMMVGSICLHGYIAAWLHICMLHGYVASAASLHN
jgi:hypothetical protein